LDGVGSDHGTNNTPNYTHCRGLTQNHTH
jgi:hypothetical protein